MKNIAEKLYVPPVITTLAITHVYICLTILLAKGDIGSDGVMIWHLVGAASEGVFLIILSIRFFAGCTLLSGIYPPMQGVDE